MTNPWPAFNPQASHVPAAQDTRYLGVQREYAEHLAMRDAQLAEWEQAKKQLDYWKKREMELRVAVVESNFAPKESADAKPGVQSLELANGYELKANRKINYKLVAPEGYSGTVIDAVEECMEKFDALSNEGSFVADRLFRWSCDLAQAEYRQLVDEAKYSSLKAKMLDEVNKILEINEGAPTLEIKEAKRKRT